MARTTMLTRKWGYITAQTCIDASPTNTTGRALLIIWQGGKRHWEIFPCLTDANAAMDDHMQEAYLADTKDRAPFETTAAWEGMKS